MNHPTARELLPAILDHTIPAAVEAAIREHVGGCGRCRRALAEFEASEALLAGLPASLVPVEPSAAAQDRLAAFARWAPDPRPEWRERVGVSALGALAATAMLLMVITVTGWGPVVVERSAPVALAAVLPDSSYLPTGWR